MNPSFGGSSSLDRSDNGGTNFNHSNHQSTSSTPSSSPPVSRKEPVIKQHDAIAISDHIYRAYLRSEYTDVVLSCQSVDGGVYDLNLHAVVISQSPYLRELLAYKYQPPKALIISLPSFLSFQAFNIAITSLYSPQSASTHITPINSFAILCAAYYLHLDSLGGEAMEVLSRGIASKLIANEEIITLVDWCTFLAGGDGILGAFELLPNGVDSFGKGMNVMLVNGSNMNGGGSSGSHQPVVEDVQRAIYIGYAQRLRSELSERLNRLPIEFNITVKDCGLTGKETPSPGLLSLMQICSKLPFEWFKRLIESQSFPIREDMDRFSLAKTMVSERRKRVGPGGSDFEETVVLQFGGSNKIGGTAVNIIRKRHQKKLWKVHGNE